MRPVGRLDPLAIVLVGDARSVHVARWADGLRARGNHVTIVDLMGRRRRPLARLAYLRELRSRIRAAAREPRAIINLHYVPSGWLALALRGLHPMVASVWGDDVVGSIPGMRGAWRARQLRGLLAASEARTATSVYLRGVVRERFGLDSRLVPFGVETSVFTPAPRASGGPVRIGFVKWLEDTYGPDILISAFARVASVADVELVLVGDGPMESSLRQQAAALGVDQRVSFLGRMPHESLPRLFQSLDVLAMPSRRESFGLSALEASACGIPVVASRVGGVPEVVLDDETGLLVPPGDPELLAAALVRLVADEQLRAELGRAGRRLVEARYEWSGCLAAMEDVYRDVLDS